MFPTNLRERPRMQKGGTWTCDHCGMDIKLGQMYVTDPGKRHVQCPKRRR